MGARDLGLPEGFEMDEHVGHDTLPGGFELDSQSDYAPLRQGVTPDMKGDIDPFIPPEAVESIARNYRLSRDDTPNTPLLPVRGLLDRSNPNTLGTIARFADPSGVSGLLSQAVGPERQGQIQTGLAQSALGAVDALSTPNNLALLGGLGGGGLLARGAGAYFGYKAAEQLPQNVKAIEQAQTTQEKARAYGDAGLNVGMGLLGAHGALTGHGFFRAPETPTVGLPEVSGENALRQATFEQEQSAKAQVTPDLAPLKVNEVNRQNLLMRSQPEAPAPAAPVPLLRKKEAEPLSDWTTATKEDVPQPATEGGEISATSEPDTKLQQNGITQPEPLPLRVAPDAEPQPEFASGIPFARSLLRRFSPLDKATSDRSAKIQASVDEANRARNEITSRVKDESRRNAISLYADEGGDVAKIAAQIPLAKTEWYRKAAKDALTLTPEERAVADHIKATFDTMKTRGNTAGVLDTARENYVPHQWDLEGKSMLSRGGTLQERFKHATARTKETFFEGDQAELKPKTLDISKLLSAYLHEMNKVIADRSFVRDLSGKLGSDGRPLVIPRGRGKTIEDGGKSTALVFPRAVRGMKDPTGAQVDQSGYKVLADQPALNKWVWAETDAAGNPTMLSADLALHPEAHERIRSMMGAPKSTGIGGAYDKVSGLIKREMFSLSPFHQVQEGWHGIGHLVDPTGRIGLFRALGLDRMKEVDARNPGVRDAAAHGLMIHPDKTSSSSYLEGVGSHSSNISNLLRKFAGPPGKFVANKIIDGYQDYLFHNYIPRLKYTTYEAINQRNMGRYAEEVKTGKLSAADVKALSARQTNAAYGHLNYALMSDPLLGKFGRNPEAQRMMQRLLLAPDFLEARARFTGQAAKTLFSRDEFTGKINREGLEQFKSMTILAGVQISMAVAASAAMGGQWDYRHPFEITVGNRRYSWRSVPEDIQKAFTETRQFASGRINPFLQTIQQLISGLNYRGEDASALETLKEFALKFTSIPSRSIAAVRDFTESGKRNPVSPGEQLAGTLGLQVHRDSDVNDAYQLAGEWKKQHGMEKPPGNYPVSDYQGLRYALEDNDSAKAKREYEKLLKTKTDTEIIKGFQASVEKYYTGSKQSDVDFRAQLDEDGRQIVDKADQQRGRMLRGLADAMGVKVPSREQRALAKQQKSLLMVR